MFVYDRFACSIPDPSSASVIVIGGFNTQNKVSRYSRAGLYCVLYCTVLYYRYGREGWLEDLSPLNVGRWYHGCGGYVSSGDMVSTRIVPVI